MKILVVVRHGKAVWSEGAGDHERVLDEEGRADAVKLGALLREEGIVPELVLSSTAVRAATTAALIVEGLGEAKSIIEEKEALYNATAETILSVVQGIDEFQNVVMVVGHNPGISNFVSLITDGGAMNMGTCDVAIIGLEIRDWGFCLANTGFLSRYIENY